MPHFCDAVACCPCLYDEDTKTRRETDRKINREIKKNKQHARKEIKMLLLGTEQAGKSTITKQMRIIHGQEFQDVASRLMYAQSVRENVLESIRILLQNMERFSIRFANEYNEQHRRTITEQPMELHDAIFFTSLFPSIATLWEDAGVRECYRRRGDFEYNYLSDSGKYFLDQIATIADPRYVPTKQDILRVRKSSTGIQEYDFKVSDFTFRVVDVGGQRSERRKWIHCFENVTAMIFVASLSDYDQFRWDSTAPLGEERVNRMEESFALFGVVHNKFLQTASIILFLNKTDIFEEKIQERDLVDYFPDYGTYRVDDRSKSGGPKRDAKTAQRFVHSKYTEIIQKHVENCTGQANGGKKTRVINSEKEHMLYSHYTCATDTASMKFVTTAAEDHILQRAVAEFHLI